MVLSSGYPCRWQINAAEFWSLIIRGAIEDFCCGFPISVPGAFFKYNLGFESRNYKLLSDNVLWWWEPEKFPKYFSCGIYTLLKWYFLHYQTECYRLHFFLILLNYFYPMSLPKLSQYGDNQTKDAEWALRVTKCTHLSNSFQRSRWHFARWPFVRADVVLPCTHPLWRRTNARNISIFIS